MKVFHAHVYFDRPTRKVARRVRDGLVARFAVDCRWRDEPIGPHTKPNFRVRFARDHFGRIVPWLMRHRESLSVLVHPYSEDHLADHTEHALWLGKRVPLNVAFLRRRTTEAATKRP